MHVLNIILGIVGLLVVLGLLGAVIFLMVKKDNDPARMAFKVLLTAAIIIGAAWYISSMTTHLGGGMVGDTGTAMVMMGIIVACGIALSIMWTPFLSDLIISPLTNIFDGGNEPPEQKPFYSIAMTKRNRGKPQEAVAEIRRQLERFPHDFEGIMLMARIQAEDLADLAGAENTLNHFCNWPDAPAKQVAAGYTQLADWHLKLSADADAARAALQQIIAHFPGTAMALQAEQRIAHLSEAEKVILAHHDQQDVYLPQGAQNIGLLDSTEFLKPQELEPGQVAAAHVKHLADHPNDTEVREKLAIIYARDFKRLDMATMELAQLINEPSHKPRQVAHWLNLLANFQVELGADMDTVRSTLEKIVERFPTLPVADLAQRRLMRLENEFKSQSQGSNVKMGVYEQNIGLKYGRPRGSQ